VEEAEGARQEAAGDFPRELVDFMGSSPRLLLVRGRPRTGKTAFCLGLSEAVSQPQNVFIVSTRALDPVMYEKFPWLRQNEARDRSFEVLFQVARPPPKKTLPPPKPPEEEARIKSAKEMLRDIMGEVPEPSPAEGPEEPEPDRTELAGLRAVIGKKDVRELLRVYRGLARVPPGASGLLVMLDRADRLCEKNGIELAQLAGVLRDDLSAKFGAGLILVLDRPTADLDGTADAVVNLKEVGQGEDFLGQLELIRLGDLKVKYPRWMYNLRGGRFKVLPGMRAIG